MERNTTRRTLLNRSFRDDMKWALAYLFGVAVGYVLLGPDSPGLVVGAVIGVTCVIVALNVIRAVARQRPERGS